MPDKTVVLKKRKDFLRVAKGAHVATSTAVLQAALSLYPEPASWRVGFTATKKIGKAYVRNRAKRRLRAVVREVFPSMALPNAEYVLIGRQNTYYCPYETLVADIKSALKRINKQLVKNDDKKSSDCAD